MRGGGCGRRPGEVVMNGGWKLWQSLLFHIFLRFAEVLRYSGPDVAAHAQRNIRVGIQSLGADHGVGECVNVRWRRTPQTSRLVGGETKAHCHAQLAEQCVNSGGRHLEFHGPKNATSVPKERCVIMMAKFASDENSISNLWWGRVACLAMSCLRCFHTLDNPLGKNGDVIIRVADQLLQLW